MKATGPLTDPAAHGGSPQDAFHMVVPSLPGFGFSDRPGTTGWTNARIAAAWAALMERPGYTRYIAQGGDWGGAVTTQPG
ncbi:MULTISPECIES: alpha/beta fold hydrolase [unclassified Streptomyces]|uniref:alpha/beta fold hydrolase n=1 Tax=unclassified Streptomyces TaxID=2593676 RepID=UPI00069C7044|nr:alpha/beta fold hydrolase [Streptomyces sp. CNQ-509]